VEERKSRRPPQPSQQVAAGMLQKSPAVCLRRTRVMELRHQGQDWAAIATACGGTGALRKKARPLHGPSPRNLAWTRES